MLISSGMRAVNSRFQVDWTRKAQSPNRCQFGFEGWTRQLGLVPRRGHIRAAAMRHLSRHANALAQGGVRVDGFADVHCVCAHLDGQRHFANHVARMGADHATAQDLALAQRHGSVLRGCRQTGVWSRLRRGRWQWRRLMPSRGTGPS